MKIIKVVVDKLPVSCWECDLSDQVSGDFMCVLYSIRDIFDVYQRPDWCPLVVELTAPDAVERKDGE
jgi:hypothetical protein